MGVLTSCDEVGRGCWLEKESHLLGECTNSLNDAANKSCVDQTGTEKQACGVPVANACGDEENSTGESQG